jgi:galactonate dehydratase
MKRRAFLKSLAAVPAMGMFRATALAAQLPRARITKVRIFQPPEPNLLFNQSNMLCAVDTDIGITGIGEGGSKDTLEQCAGTLIGKDPFRIEAIWQEMYIAWFYPPGREKTHAVGAMDLALWDIKGKALKLPVHELLGGSVRRHCECYGTTTVAPSASGRPATLRDRAKAAMDAGYRSFRMGAADVPVGQTYNTHEMVRRVIEQCKEAREGVGPNGDWCIDFHQRFDYNDAVRACRGIEEFEPYFVEDPVRAWRRVG